MGDTTDPCLPTTVSLRDWAYVAKGFVVNGARVIMIDVNEPGLGATEAICREAAASVGMTDAEISKYVEAFKQPRQDLKRQVRC